MSSGGSCRLRDAADDVELFVAVAQRHRATPSPVLHWWKQGRCAYVSSEALDCCIVLSSSDVDLALAHHCAAVGTTSTQEVPLVSHNRLSSVASACQRNACDHVTVPAARSSTRCRTGVGCKSQQTVRTVQCLH
jgi:hypothetical protein